MSFHSFVKFLKHCLIKPLKKAQINDFTAWKLTGLAKIHGDAFVHNILGDWGNSIQTIVKLLTTHKLNEKVDEVKDQRPRGEFENSKE